MGKRTSFRNCIPRELPVFMFFAVLCGVLVGLGCGALNGLLITLLGHGFNPLVLMLGVFADGIVAMRSTRAGRRIYAVGGNEESARLAGISPGQVKMVVGSTFQSNDAVGYELPLAQRTS